MRFLRGFIVVLVLVTLTGCSVFGKKKKEDEVLPSAEEIYNDAFDKLEKKRYKQAIEKFEDIERTYPYAVWATKAQLMSAYASYKGEEYDDAIAVLEKFVKLHPGNKDVEYAYYLKALCYYEQISDVDRDQSYSLYARTALKELIARFPDSKYSRDAEIKLDLVTDHLAGKEVAVGRFYLKQGNVIAAINRFKAVLSDYQTTAHVQEALHRLVESYISLGVVEEAEKYAAVLGHNYPDSRWYKYSYKLLRGEQVPEDSTKMKKQGSSWFNLKMPFSDDGDNEKGEVLEVKKAKKSWFNFKIPFSGKREDQSTPPDGQQEE